MGRAEIIDLLSTDDEAQTQTLNADHPRVPASSFVYPMDIGSTGLPQRESKRRKLSPSSSPVGDVSTDPRLPVNASPHPWTKPNAQGRTGGFEEWTAVDGSDPIVFTSSATAGAVILRTHRRRSSSPLSKHSEDFQMTCCRPRCRNPAKLQRFPSELQRYSQAYLIPLSV